LRNESGSDSSHDGLDVLAAPGEIFLEGVKQQSALYPDLQIIVVMRRVIACCPDNNLHGMGLVLVVDTVSISVYFSWYKQLHSAALLWSNPGFFCRVENVNGRRRSRVIVIINWDIQLEEYSSNDHNRKRNGGW
jgi:hypothetical protein